MSRSWIGFCSATRLVVWARIVRVRLQLLEMHTNMKWKSMWGYTLCSTKYPNVFRKQEGGFVVRGRVTDPLTGKLKEILRSVECSNEVEALRVLEDAKERVRSGSRTTHKQLFSEFATSLLERKIARRDIRSQAGKDKWRHTLTHLIVGTEKAGTFVPGFGDFYVDEIRAAHVERWLDGLAQLIRAQAYSPTTINGWLSILRVLSKAAAREYEMRDFMSGVEDFDTSEHSTYSEEEPNSLAPEDVPRFLAELRASYPQFYAMAVLGFTTGLRPSTLRPLRRKGGTPDVLWDEGRVLLRQSQTRGEHVMQATKTGKRYSVHLPQEVMAVLRWHVDTQLRTPEQQESDLLFPATTGGFRAPTVLNKPFAEVAEAIQLGYPFTQRGMRRTFQDLARAAQVADLVTRSISGHSTERMQHHYSTVRGDEQREGLARVVQLVTPQHRHQSSDDGGGKGGGTGASGGGMERQKA